MAGIYLHIPFCKQACYYCDFHFSTNIDLQEKMIEALLSEITIQSNYLGKEILSTIYFGGGTPSLLSPKQLDNLLDKVHTTFKVSEDIEITLEANPDDLSVEKLNSLKSLGINRLSIGLQSFSAPHLSYLNRIHTSKESLQCIAEAQNAGFENISIDLIYGIPANNHDVWRNDIETAISLGVEHISAYCLTIEDSTVFGNWLKKGKIKAVEDDFSAEQFEIMIEKLEIVGYEQYEVSNFAKPDMYSKHNSSYWQQIPYLGIGPGAHSFNGSFRQYNISNNPKYIKSINEGAIPYTTDPLTKNDFINERILISLRTKWGLDVKKLKNELKYDLLKERTAYLQQLEENGLVTLNNSILTLTTKGKLLADYISTELFID